MSRHFQAWTPPPLALLPPLAALAVQSWCWHWLQPLIWFLFYPAVFLSSWIGGFRGGLWATFVSAALVIFCFIEPRWSFKVADGKVWLSVVLFCGMGILFASAHERLKQSEQMKKAAAAKLQHANEWLEARVLERTKELTVIAESQRQSDARLAGIVGSAMDAIISVDSDEKIILFNAAAETMFRCTAADVLGGPLDRFIPERLRTVHQMHVQAFGSRDVTSRPMHSLRALCGVRADGEEFPLEASISQSKIAGQPVYTVILRDTTERRRDEAAKVLLAAIVESSDDAIVGKDLNGVVTSWNAGAEKMFGYSAGEMMGHSITRLIPPHRLNEEEQILGRIREGGRVNPFETVRLTNTGQQIAVSVTVSPIKDQQGRIVGASKVARDITEQQRSQAALRLKQEHSKALLRLARRLERAESLSDILDAAGDELASVLGLPHAWFYLFSDDRQTLRLIMANDRHDGSQGEELTIKGDPMLEAIAAAEDIVVVDYARTDPRTNKEIVARLGSRTIVNMPVMMSGRRLGTIGAGTFGDEGVRQLSQEEREFFAALASQVAAVLDRTEEIHKRQQAETALRASEMLRHEADHRLAEIVHGMNEACFALDADWRFVFVNDRCETLLKHRREQMLGQSIWEVFDELVGTPMEAYYRRAMVQHVPVAFEALSPIAQRWLDIRLFPSADGIAAFLLDIHERKQSELALRDSEERLRVVTENARVGLVIVNKDRRYEYANTTCAEILGIPLSSILGQRVEDVMGDLYKARVEAHLDCVFSGERVSFEVCRPTAAEDHFYAAIYEPWRVDGAVELMVGVITDITERKQAENEVIHLNSALEQRVMERTTELADANVELSHSRAELKSLFESLPGLYLVLTPELQIVAASDAYLTATMLPREAVIGNALFDVFPDNPADPQADGEAHLRASLQRVLQTAVPDTMAIQKYDVRRPDGQFEERYWSPVNSPVFGADRTTKFIVHRVEDVTDFVRQKTATSADDPEARARLQQMEAEIFNSSQKLQAANQQLQASNKELESFAYSVSHDLRAPLRAMDGFSRALVEDYGSLLPTDGARYVQIIRNSAQKMGHLIDDLLTFSRLSRAPLSTRDIDTHALVRSVLEDLAMMREGRQVELHVGELAPCTGDPALLRQVWINLLSNAFKYTRKREDAVIAIGCTHEGNQTTFFVRDNGAGFDMRYAHKLFGVFQRLHRAEDYEGTGVGLAIVQRVIHRHGGSIWAEASVDQGATFYFSLDGGSLT